MWQDDSPEPRKALITLTLTAGLVSAPSFAVDFRVGEVEGLLDVTLAYGVQWRLQSRDKDIIALANGGNGFSANMDAGDLNYDTGKLTSNMVKGTGELTLRWRDLGAFVRGYGFYDYENEHNDRERTELSGQAKDQVGSDLEFLDAYLSARFEIGDSPTQFRLGRQVVNWGQSVFFQNGVNIINPLNVPAFQQPVGTRRDLFLPVGMLWGSSNITEEIAVEGFYQYEWRHTIAPPVGSFFSTQDIGAAGANFATLGTGSFSDLGTNVCTTFGVPASALPNQQCFDSNFLKAPRTGNDTPSEQGQFGFTVQAILPKFNDSLVALHFANYHSRLPVLQGMTADQATVNETSLEAVREQAAGLVPSYLEQGLDLAQASAAAFRAAGALTQSNYANNASYNLKYTENIQMIGLSFNTTTIWTGTALSGEVSHHIDVPLAIDEAELLSALFSAVEFNPAFKDNQIGVFGANEKVDGFIERDKTQVVLGATQLFGPRLGATQTALALELGWIHIWDMPSKSKLRLGGISTTTSGNPSQSDLPGEDPSKPFGGVNAGKPYEKPKHFADADSFAYRVAATLNYANVFGGVNVRPRVIWSHDFSGITPSTAGNFVEGKKSITLGLQAVYLNSITANLSYTNFWGAGRHNLLTDRDFLNFSVAYSF